MKYRWIPLTPHPDYRDAPTAAGLDDEGRVVGAVREGKTTIPALWDIDGGPPDLLAMDEAPQSGTSSTASALNAQGVICGQINGKPVLWTPQDDVVRLPLDAGYTYGMPMAINDAGEIAGAATFAKGQVAAFWDASGRFHCLSTERSRAYGVNSAGTVVGEFEGKRSFAPNGDTWSHSEAFTWTLADGLQPLPGLNKIRIDSNGRCIADDGRIGGSLRGSNLHQPVIWTAQTGATAQLNGTKEGRATVTAITPTLLAGSTHDRRGPGACIWTDADGFLDLNTLIDGPVPGRIGHVLAANTAGQLLVIVATDHQYGPHGVLNPIGA